MLYEVITSAFNMIVIRTYIGTIPESLIESARIDGAGDFKIFIRIIFPLCKPVLATIALFVAVGAWNSWFDAFIYTSSKQELSTLQYELMKLLSSSMNANSNPAVANGAGMTQDAAASMVTPLSIRAAVTVVASVPILIVYPVITSYSIHYTKLYEYSRASQISIKIVRSCFTGGNWPNLIIVLKSRPSRYSTTR